MSEISQLRQEIDLIQSQMILLFKKRLELAKKIWEIKRSKEMSFVDVQRESDIIHQFDQEITDINEKLAVQKFLTALIVESKNYLRAQQK